MATDRGQKTSADGLMTLAMAHQSATAEPGLAAHASQGVGNKTPYHAYNSGYISSALPASVEPSTPKTVEKSTASVATDSASAATGAAVMEAIGKPSSGPLHGRGSRQVEPGLPAESSGAAALSDVKTTATTWRADSVASNIRGGVDTSTHAASTTAHGPMRSGAIAAVATGTDAALPVVPPLGEMISQATSGVQGAMTASPSEGPASSAPVLDLGSPGWQQVVAHQVSSATHGQSISLQTNPIHLGPIHIQVQRGGGGRTGGAAGQHPGFAAGNRATVTAVRPTTGTADDGGAAWSGPRDYHNAQLSGRCWRRPLATARRWPAGSGKTCATRSESHGPDTFRHGLRRRHDISFFTI